MTRQDYRCPSCGRIEERQVPLGRTLHLHCGCGTRMTRYFGRTCGKDLPINYGFRPGRYASQVDEDIANFQFTNL